MRRILIALLFLPLQGFTQTQWTAFDTIPKGVTRIEMPQSKYDSWYRGAEFVIANETDYKSLFPDSVRSKLPVIDFNRYELLSKTYCEKCLTVCRGLKECHRDACRYKRNWYLADKHNFIKVDTTQLLASDCFIAYNYSNGFVCTSDSCFSDLKQTCTDLRNDTVDFTKMVVLTRSDMVDCNANVTQYIYLDTLNRCVVWRTTIADGGCHAMIDKTNVIMIPKPPAGYRYVFEEYRVKEEGW